MQTMRAAVFEGEGRLILKDVPVPVLSRPDQVLLSVEAVSICGTDVHMTRVPPGYPATPGTILGHEFVGVVVEKGGQVHHLEVGDRVVVNPNDYCGACAYCRKNLPNHCERIEALGIDYDGAFAEYCLVSGRVAYKIGKDVAPGVAACAEPLACALNGLKKVRVLPGDRAAVVGGGPIGLMLGMLLHRSGADEVTILETSPHRREFARKLGFAVIDPASEDAADRVMRETRIGADIVFDATGSQIVSSVALARKGGSVVLFGVNKKALAEFRQAEVTTREVAVLGTWLANATFPEAVRLLEGGSVDVGTLITDKLPLESLHEGIEKLARGEAVKVIIRP